MTLEQRIATALSSNTRSADLAALTAETESAITQVETTAGAEKEKALNPALSPDPRAARLAMEDAAFAATRLRKLLPRLQQKLHQVAAAEERARWLADYERVKVKIDQAAKKFAEYPELAARLIEIFREAEAVDQEVSRVDGSAPAGEHRRLRGVELIARGLESFTRDSPSIAETVQLPDWQDSNRMTWPPPQPLLAAVYAAMMVPQYDPRRYSADWAAAMEEDNARRAANERRWAEEEAARQAESKRVYEASLRR